MAITKKDCEILFYSKTCLGASFSKTLMLGRLQLYASEAEVESLKSIYERETAEVSSSTGFDTGYSEPLFEALGASQIDSLDFSDYEDATIIHDLNKPIPEQYHNRFSAIVDGGTIEHVFDFPTAIKSCMDCLEVGGFYIGITPANNQMGHGFYQFSPELYYRVFSPENGFKVENIFIVSGGEMYKVMDPKLAGSRVELVNSKPASLVVIAKKTDSKKEFTIPQQSDYINAWSVVNSIKSGQQIAGESRIKHLYRRMMPRRLKIIVRNLYDLVSKEKHEDEQLGTINPTHFQKIKLSPRQKEESHQ